MADAWQGLTPARVVDCHVHVVGLGTGQTGCWVNARMRSLSHPLAYARFDIYRRAAGIEDLATADQQYVARLLKLGRQTGAQLDGPHGKLMVLAFDRIHRPDGSADDEASEFYVPNDYALDLAAAHPDVLMACASIHPYRKDAVAELERVAGRGARCIKWLPSAMRIDPSSPQCDAFYAKLVELRIPLLSHAGEEKAVEVAEAQKLANPLRLRRPLDAGVKVIVAHCASTGVGEDLDAAGESKPRVANFELFLRMMDDGRHKDRLWGEISATTQFNRSEVLQTLLKRSDLHARLVNGSDYPLPAINALLRTGKLVSQGLLTEEQRTLINEIDQHNPLAFDFVIKRALRGSGGERFADSIFMPPPGLFPES
jgi:mannonate dehydratase